MLPIKNKKILKPIKKLPIIINFLIKILRKWTLIRTKLWILKLFKKTKLMIILKYQKKNKNDIFFSNKIIDNIKNITVVKVSFIITKNLINNNENKNKSTNIRKQ